MVRTQIYLTDEQRAALKALAETSGKSQAELIREAVDRLIAESGSARRGSVLATAAGMWRHRTDLPDFAQARRTWDRSGRS